MKRFALGWLLGLFTALGCASVAVFPYKYYTPELEPGCYDNGQLLGKPGSTGWPDLSALNCKPDPMPSPGGSPSPGPSPVLARCMVMNIQEFYNMKASWEICQNDLASCQAGPTPQ